MSTSLERRIIIGLIVSTEYVQRIRTTWESRYLQSSAARRIASWCIEYYDEYEKAPFKDIEGIYTEKLKTANLPKDIAEEIEEDILPSLSEEYERESLFNLDYLYDQTKKYFHERRLYLHQEEIRALIEEGNLTEADAVAEAYRGQVPIADEGLELGSEQALVEVENAFNRTIQTVVTYPGSLGEMWNDQLIRGGFVGLMGPEKRGKSYWLLDIGMKAIIKKANVAFFQAGDMTEAQQLKRICVYLTKKSDKLKYCQQMYLPVKDCLLNQFNLCDKDVCECKYGSLEDLPKDNENVWKTRKRINFKELLQAYEQNSAYAPCYNCNKWKTHGAVWLKPLKSRQPLQAKEAKIALSKFFNKYKRRFKLSTHVSGTLTVKGIRTTLDIWEKQDGFVPDVILVDYADLLTVDDRMDFRHQQDQIWRGLRGLPQERHCLLVTATQTDADSYGKDRLGLSNYSEDKRKYAHVTAMYGLNQDKDGREKEIGLMRINEIVVREGEFSSKNEVYVMQKLQIGRPFLGSFK